MTEAELPVLSVFRRPRWRPEVPVLWRTKSSVQIGDDVIIDRVTQEHVSWLVSLDGIRTNAEVQAELPIRSADAQRLLRALVAAGGLVDAATMPHVARSAARERDALMRDFDIALDTYREPSAALAAIANRANTRLAIIGGPTVLADALASAAADARIATVDDAASADLVILTGGPHPDVPAQLEPDLGQRPYLHVGVGGSRAVVGPLVVPGVTGCLRCAHLHRRDADPAWPVLAVQLAHGGGRALDPLLARTAAIHALLLVRAWADAPDELGHWADAAVEIRLPALTGVRLDRPPHPLCGCRWQQDWDQVAQ